MPTTPEQLQRVRADYARLSGEPVDLELVGTTLYVYASELATLRLFRLMPHCRQGHSINPDSFYFAIDLV